MRSMKYYLKSVSILFIIILITSCSYGFLNFSEETGELRLEFYFSNDNALNVDKIEYELTPPKGLSSTISREFSGRELYETISNMDTGAWSLKGTLYADKNPVKEFEYNIEIVNDIQTSLRMEAFWDTDDYDLQFETFQNPVDDSSDNNTAVGPQTLAFSISGIKMMPAVFHEHFSNKRLYSVNIRFIGSNLDSNVNELRMIYPDGYLYEYGYLPYNEYNNRSILLTQYVEDGIIAVQRNQLPDGVTPNGLYRFTLTDNQNLSDSHEEVVDLAYDAMMPDLIQHNSSDSIPVIISRADPHDYKYSFSSNIGTMIVLIVNKQNGQIYPNDNTMVVGNPVDIFSIPGGTLPVAGEYELLLIAMEYSTTTPVEDATAAGVSPDMRSGVLLENLYDIYEENTGYVCFRKVSLYFTD